MKTLWVGGDDKQLLFNSYYSKLSYNPTELPKFQIYMNFHINFWHCTSLQK